MMRGWKGWTSVAASVLIAGCAGGGAEIVQDLGGFNNPESAAFSLDGKWVYVTNCASGQFGADKHTGMVTGEASIVRLSVREDGTLAMSDRKFVEGLTAALGITVAPQDVGPYPKGSLFVSVGNALQTDVKGNPVTDATKLGTGIAVFHGETGKPLGKIDLGVGSAVAIAIGHPLVLPNGLAFDGEGGLVVADTGKGAERLVPKLAPNPGVLRLAIGAKGDVTGQTFTPVSGGPNGVAWDAKEKALYWVTCGGKGPEGGALYRNGKPVALGLGPSDGIAITPAGTVIVSRFQGDLVAIRKGGTPEPLSFDKMPFKFPSDIKLRTLEDGSSIVIVPEQEAWNATPWGQSLRVVRLRAGY